MFSACSAGHALCFGRPNLPQRGRDGAPQLRRAERRPPLAGVERLLQQIDRVLGLQRSQRFHRSQIDGAKRALAIEFPDDVLEQRNHALAPHGDQRRGEHFPRLVGAGGQRALQLAIRLVRADRENGAHRLALHVRLCVVEQRRQVRQRLRAAELAQQVDRGPPHGRVGRPAQLLDGVLPGGAEAEQNLREPLARDGALFDGERLGETFDD